jgi:hypothetical protein
LHAICTLRRAKAGKTSENQANPWKKPGGAIATIHFDKITCEKHTFPTEVVTEQTHRIKAKG